MQLTVVFPINRIDNYLLLALNNLNSQNLQNFYVCFIIDSKIVSDVENLIIKTGPKYDYEVIESKIHGLAYSLNRAVEHVNTEFFARWDSDDLFDADRLKIQLEYLIKHRSVVVVGTRVKHIDESGEVIKNHQFKFFETNSQIRRALKYRQPFMHSAVMCRTEIIKTVGAYRYGLTSEDHQLWITIARNKEFLFANISSLTSYYRLHTGSVRYDETDYKKYAEIAGFFFTEFLLTGHLFYILGIIANHPIARALRSIIRSIKNA